MELHIKTGFECVLLINGELYERADCLEISEFDVIYVTALPLNCSLLPYTVKLAGAENISSELAVGIRLGSDHYLLTLSPRYMTVYSCAPPPPQPSSPICRLFSLVKDGEIDAAYSMLSDELKSAIDKDSLTSFFAPYENIAECSWEPQPGRFFLIGNGAARLHSYTVDGALIDDIVEIDS